MVPLRKDSIFPNAYCNCFYDHFDSAHADCLPWGFAESDEEGQETPPKNSRYQQGDSYRTNQGSNRVKQLQLHSDLFQGPY